MSIGQERIQEYKYRIRRYLGRLLRYVEKRFLRPWSTWCKAEKLSTFRRQRVHPACFSQWVNRQSGRVGGGFPNQWRTDPRLPLYDSKSQNHTSKTNSDNLDSYQLDSYRFNNSDPYIPNSSEVDKSYIPAKTAKEKLDSIDILDTVEISGVTEILRITNEPGLPEISEEAKRGNATEMSGSDFPKVAVVIHVFYLDLLNEIVDRLENIPVEFDVFVTNATGQKIADDLFLVGKAQHSLVFEVANHGRDIFPLVQLVNSGILDNYELILKVHTKKSVWRVEHADLSGNGKTWRTQLLDSLLGLPNTIASNNVKNLDGNRENNPNAYKDAKQNNQNLLSRILGFFAENPQVGVVTAPGSLLRADFWGGNKYLVTELAKRLELEVDDDSLEFPAGSMYWIRGFVLQGLRALCLSETDFDVEAGQIDGTTAHAIERLIGICTIEAGLTLTTSEQITLNSAQSYQYFSISAKRRPVARFIPFYLPQFYPNEHNNRWWGHGFTDWANVAASRPVFLGHNQPLLPADLGFYDLRLDEVRTAQAQLAKWAGIQGFMYYYYWFSGQKLLDVPLRKLSENSELEQCFCLMWANENWTRSWDGGKKDILIAQEYDKVSATSLIDEIAGLLLDARYLRVNGKAILAVYRPAQIPDLSNTVQVWRQRARDLGIGELLLLAVDVALDFDGVGSRAQDYGLDGLLKFPPHGLPWRSQTTGRLRLKSKFWGNLLSYQKMVEAALADLDSELSLVGKLDLDDEPDLANKPGLNGELNLASEPDLSNEPDLANKSNLNCDPKLVGKPNLAGKLKYPGVMVNFDNTARRQWSSDIWWGSNPYSFHRWLLQTVSKVKNLPEEERLVFINAWNEWAESAVLEPSVRWGKTYLLAVRNVAFS